MKKQAQRRATVEPAARKPNEDFIHILYVASDYINSLKVERND